MPERSTRPDAVRGAGADMFTLPSGPSGRPSLEMFFHCAATGIEMTTKAMASAAARILMAAESIKGDRRLVLTYLGDSGRVRLQADRTSAAPSESAFSFAHATCG